MDRRKNLVALEAAPHREEEPQAETVEVEAAETPVVEEYYEEEEAAPRNRGWMLPALAVLAIAAWTGFFGWVHQGENMSGANPEVWAGWISDWAVPVMLVVALWLLAMRNSTRESRRFGDAAQMLAAESAALEVRLSAVNRELSMARDFIASQSRDLESLGRIAAERLSTNADRLQDLIRDNGEQVNAIGKVSDTALSNMDRLRDQLPVISNATRDLASQIGNAGNTAQGRLDDLISGFERLNQFGQASSRQVDAFREKADATLAALETRVVDLERLSGERFDAIAAQDGAFRLELETRETEALAAIRRRATELREELDTVAAQNRASEDEAMEDLRVRIAALREEGLTLTSTMRDGHEEARTLWDAAIAGLKERMTAAIGEISRIDEAAINNARRRLQALTDAAKKTDESIVESADAFETQFARRRAEIETEQQEAIAALEGRISRFDESVAERQQEHLAHIVGLAERGDALSQRLAQLDGEMARIAESGREESARLGAQSEEFSEKLSQSRAILEESGDFLARLTDDSVRLLEIIRAGSEHSEGALSEAIARAEGRLASFEQKTAALNATLADAGEKGSALLDHVTRTGAESASSMETLEALETRLSALAEQSGALAEQARSDLQDAIAKLEAASTDTLASLRSGQADAVREIAERIGSDGSDAIERAMREGAAVALADLDKAATEASEKGRATAAQLRDQLAKVNELASNLEQRVDSARARAEEQVDSDFARRMALISESLNSSSIDIAKAFDVEVADTAWASYLRGDRGIFTRRAVKLLDTQEARAISELYSNSPDLRETINRYIHDFEAMLRTVLSTRDGNAMAVTLLSSDIGKLYVALAQAIERLRN